MRLAEEGDVLSAFGSSLELCAEGDGFCAEEELFSRDGASRTRVVRACSVGDGEDVLCFGDVCAVAGENGVAVAEDTVSVTKGEA